MEENGGGGGTRDRSGGMSTRIGEGECEGRREEKEVLRSK